jgi:hypothetical protein
MLDPQQVPNKKADVKNIWNDLDTHIQLQISAFA